MEGYFVPLLGMVFSIAVSPMSCPTFFFGEDQFHSIGHHDFRLAARIFSEQKGLNQRKHYVVNITGLWGAFSGLEHARHFLLSRLLNTRYTVENLATISSWLSPHRLRVGVHIRRGDFSPPFSWDYAGAVNMAWPDQWYLSIMRQICAEFGADQVDFVICSNGSKSELEPFKISDNVHLSSQLPYSDISDLLSLSECDLILPSMSTFSFWACFFSSALNLWMKENLVVAGHHSFRCPFLDSLLPVITPELCVASLTHTSHQRSFAIGIDQPLPGGFLNRLTDIFDLRNSTSNLVSNRQVFALL